MPHVMRHPDQKAFFVPVLCRPKNGYPQERAPSESSRLKSGCPHKKHVHGGGTNSHIRALRQRAAGTRAHAFCSASLQRVFKTLKSKPKGQKPVMPDSDPASRTKNFFSHPFFARPKKRCPQERAPSNSAFGCPRETHARGVGTNSHNRALRQRFDRNPRAHASLGIVATGF